MLSHPIPAATAEHAIWLRVGTLLDGSGGPPLRDAHLLYNSASILHVSAETPPANLLTPGQVQPDWHGPDATLLPGLIESHAHLFLAGAELRLEFRNAALKEPPAAMLEAARARLPKLVDLGIIAVRDAGDKYGVGLALSQLCRESARPLMPYLDSPGAAIHHRGRYGGFMAEPLEDHASPRACVEARVRAGADRIKLIPTGIINFKAGAVTTPPQMSAEELAALTAAAREFGKQTFAHASGADGIELAIDAAVDSVEHGFFIRDDQLSRLRDRNIGWVPTFAPVQIQLDHAAEMGWDQTIQDHLRRILDRHAASLARARSLGVTIIAGSDAGACGVPHGLGLLHELELMERAGLPASAVLHSASGAPSTRLAFREKFGQLQPGFRPRFIVTSHSPLERVSNLRAPAVVVFDGLPRATRHDECSGL